MSSDDASGRLTALGAVSGTAVSSSADGLLPFPTETNNRDRSGKAGLIAGRAAILGWLTSEAEDEGYGEWKRRRKRFHLGPSRQSNDGEDYSRQREEMMRQRKQNGPSSLSLKCRMWSLSYLDQR